MRAKKKRVLLFITILLILAAVVGAMFQFTQFGYLTTVPYRSAFTEIASHVYINRDYAGDRQELLEMIEQAKDRVRQCHLDKDIGTAEQEGWLTE